MQVNNTWFTGSCNNTVIIVIIIVDHSDHNADQVNIMLILIYEQGARIYSSESVPVSCTFHNVTHTTLQKIQR